VPETSALYLVRSLYSRIPNAAMLGLKKLRTEKRKIGMKVKTCINLKVMTALTNNLQAFLENWKNLTTLQLGSHASIF
jgi:hypothetical protein